jgi:hypothetical protein
VSVLIRWLVLVVVALATTEASAHQTSVKYVELAVNGDRVAVSIRLAPSDVTEPMGLPPDRIPRVTEAAFHSAVPKYVQGWLTIEGCTVSRPVGQPADVRFVVVTWMATCDPGVRGAAIRRLPLDFSRFFALDARHEVIIHATGLTSRPLQTIVRAKQPRIVLGEGETASVVAWISSGMDHIYDGIDHILFVIALLLVVMLQRGTSGLEVRTFLATVRHAALVITAFTVAHSLTLIAASLGVIALPIQLVETLIAFSIVYTAAEDVVNPAVRWRYGLTFAFGLVHGLGFASVLAELLPPNDVVVPLLCFNVGVELGQLTIVVIALPLLYGIARTLGVNRYRRILLPALAAPIFLAGIAMVIERVFEVQILPM